MALFKNLFGKKDKSKSPKGFSEVTINAIDRVTSETVKIVLDVTPSDFPFTPGQYLNFSVEIDGKEQRRSYSICSGANEPIAVAVKQVENGAVSTWFNKTAEVGMTVLVSKPEGNFVAPAGAKNIVAISAGSGITPIMSIAKNCEESGNKLRLFYGNRSLDTIIFKNEIDALQQTNCTHYLSDTPHPDHESGQLDKDTFSGIIKSDLDLLKADCFFICGPEQMIMNTAEVLELFGVSKEKIKFELFTTPVLLKTEDKKDAGSGFKGKSSVTIILDDEEETFELASSGMSVLDKASKEGIDVPYSCKGGVCSTCKAKILKGDATMTMNYSLTDKDIEEGYVLTCQAHPASEELTISYDA